MENYMVIKRNGTTEPFTPDRIREAIRKAVIASHTQDELKDFSNLVLERLTSDVVIQIKNIFDKQTDYPSSIKSIDINTIQDIVERTLIKNGFADTAKAYILYRRKRDEIRSTRDSISKTISDILIKDSKDCDAKRENGNVNGDTPMGTMLQIASGVSKNFYINNMMSKDIAKAETEGYIHIHDLDFYKLTVTCVQMDCEKLFKGGFNTGKGQIREPNSITAYASLAAVAIQAEQNFQHGGISIPNFDFAMAQGIYKSFRKAWDINIEKFINFNMSSLKFDSIKHSKDITDDMIESILSELDYSSFYNNFNSKLIYDTIVLSTIKDVERECYQAMEAFVHNLNTMHSRGGGQVAFSSINLGCDTSAAGRMVTKNLLLNIEAGLGNGETSIFPIVIFLVKEGFNYNPEDKNHDLLQLAYRVTGKRLYPNFCFEDSPFNAQYYKEGRPETLVQTMGCRTRVMGNVYDPTREISHSRGNLSFTTINLPMLAIEANHDEKKFYELLDKYLELAKKQLLERFEIQSHIKVRNLPFLMGQGIWLDSEKLGPDDEIGEVLKHGSLSIGFIGLAETLVALYGHHHGEGQEYWDKGYAIVKHMRDYTDKVASETHLNFSVLATPAESYCGAALRKCRAKYGVIEGVTDKDYFVNSCHIPPAFNITAYDKIRLEAPFHELCNAGHIAYVEVDGDASNNPKAIEAIVKCMHDNNIGYGAINHPVDTDPVCGYTGIINDTCPNCGRKETEDNRFIRLRRITGYLTTSLEFWNDAKKAEEKDRVKHGARFSE